MPSHQAQCGRRRAGLSRRGPAASSGQAAPTRQARRGVPARRLRRFRAHGAVDPFQILRVHLFAAAQNQDLLGPASDEQETVAIDKAQIPGTEPTVGSEPARLASGLSI